MPEFTRPKIPRREKLKPNTIRLPPSVWKELEELAKDRGYIVSEIVLELVRWGLYELKQGEQENDDEV